MSKFYCPYPQRSPYLGGGVKKVKIHLANGIDRTARRTRGIQKAKGASDGRSRSVDGRKKEKEGSRLQWNAVIIKRHRHRRRRIGIRSSTNYEWRRQCPGDNHWRTGAALFSKFLQIARNLDAKSCMSVQPFKSLHMIFEGGPWQTGATHPRRAYRKVWGSLLGSRFMPLGGVIFTRLRWPRENGARARICIELNELRNEMK